MPLASVVIPTYNQSAFVREAIESVLAQTFQDFEVIVVDDGSTDNTQAVIKTITDNRIKYVYKPNGGTSSARNYGFARAGGDYIAFLDHDDLWPPEFLEVMISQLEKNKEFGLVYSPITVLYPDGTKLRSYKRPKGKSGWLTLDFWKNGFIWPSAAVIRKSVLDEFYFDESLKKSYEDGDYFLRLSTRTQFLFTPEVEAIRREHAENLSTITGVLPTRILILERFYYRLGGDKIIPKKMARRRISHACRKVAETRRSEGGRSAAICLYKRAIKYWPFDVRLYLGLGQSFLLSKKKDSYPNWEMPKSLSAI